MASGDLTGFAPSPSAAIQTPQPSQNARGRVSRAPASWGDRMEVTLEDFTRMYSYEILAGQWTKRGSTLPAKGDLCLVMFDGPDNDGDAWVMVSSSEAP